MICFRDCLTFTACRIVLESGKIWFLDRIISIPKFAYKDYNHDFSNFNDDNKTVQIVIKRQ